jgi:N utilization substance protein A
MTPQATTPLENVPGLGEGVLEKLTAAGVTTVEALADMTPEQLEAIEGIGPKTVEKISLAVNNYFASLEAGAEGGAPAEGAEGEAAPEEASAGAAGEEAAPAQAESNEGGAVPDEGAAQEKTE